MKFNIITIFPKIISDYCDETILARAQKDKLIKINPIDLRDFTTDRHKTVDDTPYGGGAGMVLKVEPIYKALEHLGALRADGLRTTDYGLRTKNKKGSKKTVDRSLSTVVAKRTILLSPRGRQFDQRLAEELAALDELTFVCGRYEGVDQRVSDYMVDEEISIGPYVLAGGELGALVIIEAVARLTPGVLGNEESLVEETFGMQNAEFRMQNEKNKKNSAFSIHHSAFEYPQYTKPADFMGWQVPEVLLSGDHQKIAEWRRL